MCIYYIYYITILFFIFSGFVDPKNIREYREYHDQFINASNLPSFKNAVADIEKYIAKKQVRIFGMIDFIKYALNTYFI